MSHQSIGKTNLLDRHHFKCYCKVLNCKRLTNCKFFNDLQDLQHYLCQKLSIYTVAIEVLNLDSSELDTTQFDISQYRSSDCQKEVNLVISYQTCNTNKKSLQQQEMDIINVLQQAYQKKFDITPEIQCNIEEQCTSKTKDSILTRNTIETNSIIETIVMYKRKSQRSDHAVCDELNI